MGLSINTHDHDFNPLFERSLYFLTSEDNSCFSDYSLDSSSSFERLIKNSIGWQLTNYLWYLN